LKTRQNSARKLPNSTAKSCNWKARKADASKSFKARIDAKWTKINELNERIRKGYVDVEVQCDVYFNLPTPGLKVFWDYASARIVKTEPMTSGDRQTQLFDHREPPPELLDELLKDKDVTEE
jgi:hypothetical protein